MAKHSPKPWRVGMSCGHDTPDGRIVLISDATYETVAGLGDGPTRDADATLIAAAPDLLSAGWELSTWAAAIEWSEDGTNTAEWLEGLRDRINAFQDIARKLRVD